MHVVKQPSAPFETAGARIHQVPVLKDNLVWLVECLSTGRCAVVDGPPDAEPVLAKVAELGLELVAIWNTHTHWDHIGINEALAEKGLLDGLRVYGPADRGVPGLTDAVGEGDAVRVGEVTAQVWRTEGHLDGHVSFVLDGAVFCGDTLFAGGCGYLFDGPPAKMHQSLLRLAGLPGDTKVCCAHEYTADNLAFARFVEPGNQALQQRSEQVSALLAEGGCAVPSTIEVERATNPFLRPGSPEIRASLAAHGNPVHTHLEAFAATRALKDRKLHR